MNISNNYILSVALTVVFVLIIGLMGTSSLSAQTSPDTSNNYIYVINADSTFGKEQGKYLNLIGDVKFRQDSIVFYADQVELINQENKATAHGHIIIQRSDTVSAFANHLHYNSRSKVADLEGEVVLENGKRKLFSEKINYDMENNIAVYENNGLLVDSLGSYIFSKKGKYILDSSLVIFHDSVVVAGVDYNLITDSLHFNTETNTLIFVAPTRMKKGENLIYCEDGFYDLNNNYAELRKNAQYASPTQEAEADTIHYYGHSQDVFLFGNAKYREGDKDVSSDTIRYVKSQDKIFLIGHVVYQDSTREAVGDRFVYDMIDDSFQSEGAARVEENGQIISAKSIIDQPGSDIVIASGDVYFMDSVQNIELFCSTAIMNKRTNEVKAFGDSLLLISKMQGDSLFLTADTLEVIQDSIGIDTFRQVLLAYNNVVAYKTNFQFIADSVRYSEMDSIMQIIGNPLIWSDTTQFSANRVEMRINEEQLESIELINNAGIVNSADAIYYNQVKGRTINALMKENKLNSITVKGNAESLYYAIDEFKAYIGVNKIACGEMNFQMNKSGLELGKFYINPISNFYPMQQVNHTDIRLKDLEWDVKYRSKSPRDIFRIYELRKN